MRGLNLFEEAHIVHALPAVSLSGGKLTDVWTMNNARAVNILFSVGVSAAAFTKILVYACDNFAGDNPVAIPFNLYKEETALGDTLAAKEVVTAAGYTPSANDNIFYGIYVDAQALASLDKPCMYVQATNGTNSVIAAVIAILTGVGYRGSATGQSAIA